MGQAQRALVRLLGEANRHGNDAELFAGLVQACRYCGLYDESIAVHAEARRLDPNVPTSLGQTLFMRGDVERLLELEPPPLGTGGDEWIQARVTGLGLAGRRDESRHLLAEMRQAPRVTAFQAQRELDVAPRRGARNRAEIGARHVDGDIQKVRSIENEKVEEVGLELQAPGSGQREAFT